eukprot:scaffold82341_cov50-Phaeocystis_antarctica.AAC.1
MGIGAVARACRTAPAARVAGAGWNGRDDAARQSLHQVQAIPNWNGRDDASCHKVHIKRKQFETGYRKHRNTPALAAPRPSDWQTCTPLRPSYYLTERRAEVSEATERSPRTSACARASRLLALPLAIASCAIVGPSSVPSS